MRVVGAKRMQAADDRLDARWIDGLANVLQRVDNARVPAAEEHDQPLAGLENERHVFGDDVVLIAGGEPRRARSSCARGAPGDSPRQPSTGLKSQRRLHFDNAPARRFVFAFDRGHAFVR